MSLLLRAIAVLLWSLILVWGPPAILVLLSFLGVGTRPAAGPELMIGAVSLVLSVAAFFAGRFLWRRGAKEPAQ